ncbi:rhomboid family intramembrane serine protease [Ferdinandcohnia quinoae]|uniref:Rhomboid family intramembrane serine protease n=1 Tax=Fredinandcohnia quinoae TaxID=2918902 RepID=A0AAW5E2W7_9BACI|nr:rhomboid family intramembrane serine protease [Fredinandcohnia sp. SECRCQ15]MCH1627257.1 rhomboid family intramembrane serine protease [Fredinandcohnia sp. SECRCQ15]
MFTRTESFRSFLRFYPIISIIVAIHIILWLLINSSLPLGDTLAQQMVGFNFLIAEGEYWRLITPIFVHGGFGHMLFNSFSLILFGPALERMMGKVKFIVAYIFAGVIANIATYYFEPLNFAHVGSSGAIFGLFGIYLYMVVIRKDLIDQANSQLIMTILVIGLIMTFINSNVNIIAHIFGFVAGAIIAPLLLPKRSLSHQPLSTFNRSVGERKRIQIPREFSPKHIVWLIIIILVIIGIIYK